MGLRWRQRVERGGFFEFVEVVDVGGGTKVGTADIREKGKD
jgi:hypothetical protein